MKRLQILFLTAILVLTACFGLAACSREDESADDSVLTEEQWKKAFEDTEKATSYKVVYTDNEEEVYGSKPVGLRNNYMELVCNEQRGLIKFYWEIYNGLNAEMYIQLNGNSVIEYGKATPTEEVKAQDPEAYEKQYPDKWQCYETKYNSEGEAAELMFFSNIYGTTFPNIKKLITSSYSTEDGDSVKLPELFSLFTYDESTKKYTCASKLTLNDGLDLVGISFRKGKVYSLDFNGQDFAGSLDSAENETPQYFSNYKVYYESEVPEIVIPEEALASKTDGTQQEVSGNKLTEEEKRQKLAELEAAVNNGTLSRENFEALKELYGL